MVIFGGHQTVLAPDQETHPLALFSLSKCRSLCLQRSLSDLMHASTDVFIFVARHGKTQCTNSDISCNRNVNKYRKWTLKAHFNENPIVTFYNFVLDLVERSLIYNARYKRLDILPEITNDRVGRRLLEEL